MSDDQTKSALELDREAAKRVLLANLLEKENINLPHSRNIHPRRSSESVPLSFAQERLWFLDQLNPGHSVYNVCRAQRLAGPLDIAVLTRSIGHIVQRHEVLRSRFPTLDGQPIQVAATTPDQNVFLRNLQELPGAARETAASRLVAEQAQFSFDLALGPLLRVTLAQLGEEDFLLILTLHQSVFDGWSFNVFFRELETLYQAYSQGYPPSLPQLSVQYSDFALWQREWLRGEIIEVELSYWKKRLDGLPAVFELPTDHPRPAAQTSGGARQGVTFPKPLTRELKQLSRQERATPFLTLMTAFSVLLYRYTSREDIVIGFPIANRGQPETQNLIGSFVNTLVLRVNCPEDCSARNLLSRVGEACTDAYVHQNIPFERLIEELQPQRELNRNPLFQVMFAFDNTPPRLNLPGLKAEPVAVSTCASKFDLTLSLGDRGDDLAGFFEYSTDLFDHSTIERMMGHLRTLLEGIVANPDQPISTLPLLTEEEKHQLAVEWNDTAADYPENFCIHELFEAQVERTPEAIAVQFEEKQLSYRELNSRANQLAHYLQGLGVGPEKLVGICVERSLEMVIGLTGILKSGGAYVPMDPTYPRERLEFMLKDSQCSFLLTQQNTIEDGRWRPVLSETEGMEDGDSQSSILDPQLKVVCLDVAWETIAGESEQNPRSKGKPDNLAYVIYTSGSTGQPKGVQVSHRAVVNCLSSIGEQVGLTERDIFLAVTTISFDIASLELFLPLITGATIVLASREEVYDGKLLLNRLADCSGTIMQATPTAWKLLLDSGWRSRGGFKILCGGETLSRQLADQLLEGGGSLWNLYGPTETTIWSTIAKVEPGESTILIGRPIANTQIYILDSHLQPVPVGVVGEIYIGGAGLARGYLNRPELTTERFVLDPIGGQRGVSLYRTGDSARYRPGGNIELLGRLDNQVKIRGYRIELAEIEAALNRHPRVRESVIVARDRDSLLEQRLIGYVVPMQPLAPSVVELRDYLIEKLPDYMIPSRFVFLAAFPLTPNGKLDRNALPLPEGERPLLDQGFVEPCTEIEELVAQVWREVLKVEKVGVHDNFFDLGGHSLLATRVVSRLRTNFSIDLALRKVFELPTIAALAQHVEFLRENRSGVSLPAIGPVSRDRPLPLSFSQRRLWFLQKMDPSLTGYNIPATFRITGALNITALEQALKEIVNRHEVLRTRIIEIGGEPRQQIVSPLTFTLPVIDLSHLLEEQAETEVERLSIDDARQPYNLEEAPLMRAKLLRLKDPEHVLILNFHHIACDGSSLVTFYDELGRLYQAFLIGETCGLPALPVQYADYAVWQHEQLQGEGLNHQLAYWKRQLGTGLTTVHCPTDYERPAVQSYRGARLTRSLSEQLTKALKELSRREGVTLFMTLLATLDTLLGRHAGQDDIIVGSTIAGRNRPETEGVIGFFINALALRTDLSGNPTFLEVLKRVREVCLDAYSHQDLPFESVVEEINPDRDLSRNPLFQVVFNMADTSERILNLAGCQTTKLLHGAPSAKFDIVLHAPELDGRIEVAMVYNADLFTENRIAVLLDQFSCLLSQIAENPQERLDQYTLVTPSTRAVLPDPIKPLDKTWRGAIQTLFSRHAECQPDQLAVVDSYEAWTYRELDRRSNQLANYLIAGGIEPKDVVAIYAHRSSTLVLALLGVLKAGAVFVVLDPAYPARRLIDYLHIAKPKAWVQMEAAGESGEELSGFLDSLELGFRTKLPTGKHQGGGDLNRYPESETGVQLDAEDPAYIAFTSGSTGQPKGVLGKHGPITHFLPWQEKAFDLQPSDRFSLLSGLGYNHLHRDIFTALALGATVYVPTPEIVRSPERLGEWLEQNGITVLHLTPALGRLLRTSGGKGLSSVRCIFFGGDVLTGQDVALTRELAPNAKIFSFYGATETQRAVGYFAISQDTPAAEGLTRPIPLGRGVKDVQLLVLVRGGHLAGIGEVGELCVRSPHLAQDYIDDDTLTRERFVVNPFTQRPGDRLYRTGELGRYLPDGNVEWAGRKDRRVSIRGFRVELSEVESALSQHPAVREAAVVAQDHEVAISGDPKSEIQEPAMDRRLIAYVEGKQGQALSIDDLRCFLSARLPNYMVPSYFLLVDPLPLSPNGKVEYQRLPSLEQVLRPVRERFEPPRTEIEQTLGRIFSQVLGLERIGRLDNFFHIGGHSLLAAQVAARIRETLNVALDLRAFLEAPTIESLAGRVDLLLATRNGTVATEIVEREEIDL